MKLRVTDFRLETIPNAINANVESKLSLSWLAVSMNKGKEENL